jgi:hypothetical protein
VTDRQLSIAKVDVVPTQTKRITLAQAQHKNQHVDRIERITLREAALPLRPI